MLQTRLMHLSTSLAHALPLMWHLPQHVLAQRSDADLTASLLDGADCLASSSDASWSYNTIHTESEPVAINRQIFDRRLSIGADHDGGNTSLSCRVNSRDFSTVDLQMGITDASAQYAVSMTVNIYQGGNLKHTYNNVQAGTMINVLLDLQDPSIPSNQNSFAVEILDCSSSGSSGCYLQFVEARLYPNDSFTSFSDNSETIESNSPTNSSVNQPTTNTVPNQSQSSPQPTSSRQNAPSPASTSRQDPSPLDGVVDSFVDRLLDAIF